MNKIKKILAPTDLSDLSRTSVRHALEMAHSLGAEVIVYHVISYEEVNLPHEGFYTESLAKWLPQERKKLLSEFLRENFTDMIAKVEIKQEVEVGVPYQRIVEKAAEEGVDLVVMSTHGRTGLIHMLIGSVTEKVVQRATCPVLSIRPVKAPKLAEAVAG
ncbi:universal stress protein [bacterium]|nr:MAG: universal stress protein [bacterium]